MAEMQQDQQFLEMIVKSIVNNPDAVKATRTVDERGVLITLDVAATDIGYVIGRQGQTVRAIRTLLRVVGAKNNASVNLKINEPEGGRGPRFAREDRPQTTQPGTAPAPTNMADVDTSALDDIGGLDI
ncbi:MAG: KH domain-containing protein [Candidatus Magasanikbacteria bacterium]|nr:KH domain-containing protein [Candidatus Magasanikbacteria bacterium]